MKNTLRNIAQSALISCWFMILTMPVLVMRINTATRSVEYRWDRMVYMGLGTFVLSWGWRWYFERKKRGGAEVMQGGPLSAVGQKIGQGWKRVNTAFQKPSLRISALVGLALCFIALPMVSSIYQVTIFALALINVMLALGLNIVVGLAGQLVLGYAAFYAVGAYTYGLLNQYFGLGFWVCLPLGGLFATLAGLLLGFPVLRLRGDYLAIVTLGFGEITRLLITNLSDITGGARGISNIPKPSFFGLPMNMEQSTIYIYYLAFAATIVTIIVVARLKNSRVGIALQALREDEIACEAMGIDLRTTKLAAFALGSCWAGFAGVLLAARNSFISPASFTFMDSAIVLSMVVLGGMGSITGVVLAALVLSLLPEYLRAFSEYRMLLFGAVMVLMMIFRPQGIVPSAKRTYRLSKKSAEGEQA